MPQFLRRGIQFDLLTQERGRLIPCRCHIEPRHRHLNRRHLPALLCYSGLYHSILQRLHVGIADLRCLLRRKHCPGGLKRIRERHLHIERIRRCAVGYKPLLRFLILPYKGIAVEFDALRRIRLLHLTDGCGIERNQNGRRKDTDENHRKSYLRLYQWLHSSIHSIGKSPVPY